MLPLVHERPVSQYLDCLAILLALLAITRYLRDERDIRLEGTGGTSPTFRQRPSSMDLSGLESRWTKERRPSPAFDL
jgi:hypothetical protein